MAKPQQKYFSHLNSLQKMQTERHWLALGMGKRGECFYHTDFNQNSKCFPYISVSFGVVLLVTEKVKKEMVSFTGEERQRQQSLLVHPRYRWHIAKEATHDTDNMVLPIWQFTRKEVTWQLHWQSILSRVKAKRRYCCQWLEGMDSAKYKCLQPSGGLKLQN